MARRIRRSKRSTRRRVRGPRRYRMRKSRRTYARKNQKYHVHNFIRSVEAVYYNNPANGMVTSSNDGIIPQPGAFTGNFQPYTNGTSWSAACTFALDRSVQSTELTQLYDYYKIKAVKVTFDYAANVSTADQASIPAPRMIIMKDFDDSTFDAYSHYMQATARCTERRLTNGKFSILIKPRIKQTQATTEGVSSETLFKRAWVNCSSPTIPHWGLKFAMVDWPFVHSDNGPVSRPVLRVKFDYYIAMKGVQ